MDDVFVARFWAKVDQRGPDECWPWTGALHRPNGYGRLNAPVQYAHRFSWTLANGPISNGLYVLHRCDNPPCCNPAHLFLGTQRENMGDMAGKGRSARGTRNHWAKLTDDDVRTIRVLGKTMTIEAIARRYGMTFLPIQAILSGRTWRHGFQSKVFTPA